MVHHGAFGPITEQIFSKFSANPMGFQERNECMSNCFLKLDSRRPLKDGTFPIKIVVGHGTNVLLSTGISIPIDRWDQKNQMYHGNNERAINQGLSTILYRTSLRMIDLQSDRRYKKMTSSQIAKALTSDNIEDAFQEKKKDFYTIADMFVKQKEADNTKALYKLTLSKVLSYAGSRLNIEDMNKAWLHGFYDSMKDCKVNTKAIHMRNIRAICNYAIDEEFTDYYPFRKFCIKTEETRKRSLTIEQMRAIKNCDVTDIQREYRDMFLLMFYLMGINATDLFSAKPENIVNGRLEYRRDKTGKLYSIKIEPEAAEIIKRYRGKEWLLSPLDNYKSYKDYLHHLNNSLKTLGQTYRTSSKKKGKVICPELSSYWSRHTWATFAAELDIPDPTISLALGHSIAGHKTTSIYIRRDPAKIDAANRKVIDYLNGAISIPE